MPSLPGPGIPGMLTRVPRRVWLLLGVVAAVLALPALLWLPRHTTSNPDYCLSCHGPGGGLADRGLPSQVHPGYDEVSCTDCHAKPGQIVYEGYRKGFMSEPERVSPNCMRCHPDIPARNDQEGFKFNVLNIYIPHKLHLELGAECTDCHTNIAHDLRPNPTNRPRMDYCAQCHAVFSESCDKCHGGQIPPGPVPAAWPVGVLGDGKGLYSRYCGQCHGADGDQISGVDLKSKEFLVSRGVEAIQEIASQGHGGMPAFGVEAGGPLSHDEVRAITAYLKLSAVGLSTNGQALFESQCATCHGVTGDKMPTVDLSSQRFLDELGYERIIQTISAGRVGMPAFSKSHGGPLSYEEVTAVGRYLRVLAQGPLRAEGSALYAEHCAACHGTGGNQMPGVRLGNRQFLEGRDEEFLQAIRQGKGGMPAFATGAGGPLSEEEIRLILDYLKAQVGLGPKPPGPPHIPHSVTAGMERCLTCHGPEGLKPVPSDHAGRSEDLCRVCHTPQP